MYRNTYHPWGEFARLFNAIEGPTRAWHSTRSAGPKVNVWEDDGHLTVTAELPGVALDAINVSLHGKELTISGELPKPTSEERCTYHRNERRYGKFHRSLRLPFRADPAKANAHMKDGVLHIAVHQLAEDKPTAIAVTEG